MKKIKSILSIVLAMILLMGTVSVNATAKTLDEWENIFNYCDEKSPYTITVHQNENNGRVKYKFVIYENNNTDKIEYITQEYTLKNYEVDYDLNDKQIQYEILLKTVENDEYLGLKFTKRKSIINALKEQEEEKATHLCYDCYNCTVISEVCRKCKNDTFTMKGKNYICTKCKKNNYTSLRKTVCSKCKGTNIESIDAIWQIAADLHLEDVHQACWTKNTGAYIFAQQMLSDNWVNEKYADEFQLTWEEALNLSESKKSSEIINAIWRNQEEVATYFSETETKELIAKYEALAKEKCIGAIIDSLNGIAGAFISDDYFETIEKIFTAKGKAEEFADDVYNAKNEQELASVFQELTKEELEGILEQTIEVLPMTSSIKEYLTCFSEIVNAEMIEEAIELGNLCNEIVDDFSGFYDKYYAILNGNNTKKKYIKRLYDDIVLATTIKNSLD